MKYSCLPGDDIGPEITAAALRRARARERRLLARTRLRPARSRHGELSAGRNDAARFDRRGSARRRRRGARPVRHDRVCASRAGRHQRARNDPQAPRSLREHPARAQPPGAPERAAGARLPDRAREHRRLLLRPQHVPRQRRVHADRGRRAVGTQDHGESVEAHRAGRVRLRVAAPQAGDRRRQAPRAAALGRDIHRPGDGSRRGHFPTSRGARWTSTRWRRTSIRGPSATTSS